MIQKVLEYRQRGVELGNTIPALVWLLAAKDLAREHGYTSLMTDLMSDIGNVKTALKLPVSTFGGANMSPDELRDHG